MAEIRFGHFLESLVFLFNAWPLSMHYDISNAASLIYGKTETATEYHCSDFSKL